MFGVQHMLQLQRVDLALVDQRQQCLHIGGKVGIVGDKGIVETYCLHSIQSLSADEDRGECHKGTTLAMRCRLRQRPGNKGSGIRGQQATQQASPRRVSGSVVTGHHVLDLVRHGGIPILGFATSPAMEAGSKLPMHRSNFTPCSA